MAREKFTIEDLNAMVLEALNDTEQTSKGSLVERIKGVAKNIRNKTNAT